MQISGLLLQSYVNKLDLGFRALYHQIFTFHSDESYELKSQIEIALNDLNRLKNRLQNFDQNPQALVPAELHESYKYLKLQLHFANRKFLRFISNQARMQKIQEKRTHVSTFAA